MNSSKPMRNVTIAADGSPDAVRLPAAVWAAVAMALFPAPPRRKPVKPAIPPFLDEPEPLRAPPAKAEPDPDALQAAAARRKEKELRRQQRYDRMVAQGLVRCGKGRGR